MYEDAVIGEESTVNRLETLSDALERENRRLDSPLTVQT